MTPDPSAVTEALAEEDQSLYERLVFRVLDVDHEDYQAAVDGFAAICQQADRARSWVEGTTISWCTKHGLPRADGIEEVCAIGYMPLFDPDEDLPCRIVSKRLCDGIDGGDET